MKKQKSLGINSFTLIETLISLIIVSILLSGFSKLISNDSNYLVYQNLQKAQNEFTLTNTITSTYKEFTLKSQ